jgi:hypothetical protein
MEPRPEDAAMGRAVAHLVTRGFIEIRSLATELSRRAENEPVAPTDPGVLARIRTIAEVCHSLSSVLAEDDAIEREKKARWALTYRWAASSAESREWIMSALGADIAELLERDRRVID